MLISLFGPISGPHFNPAVTAVMATLGRQPWRETPVYLGAQVLGGLRLWSWRMPSLPSGRCRSLSQRAMGLRSGWREMVATFALLINDPDRRAPQARSAAWLVALLIVSAYWFTASTSFANLR